MRENIFLFIVLFSTTLLAGDPVAKDRLAMDTIGSSDWSCRYSEKRIIDPPVDGSADSVGALCQTTVACTGVAGSFKGYTQKMNISCRAIGHDSCPDLRTCGTDNDNHLKEFATDNAKVSLKASLGAPDDNGRSCQYRDPKTVAVTFWKKHGKRLGHVCTNRVKCTSKAGNTERLVSCKASVSTKAGGEEEVYCPQYYDCADKETGRPGYTEDELHDLKRRGIVLSSSKRQHD